MKYLCSRSDNASSGLIGLVVPRSAVECIKSVVLLVTASIVHCVMEVTLTILTKVAHLYIGGKTSDQVTVLCTADLTGAPEKLQVSKDFCHTCCTKVCIVQK